MAITLRQRRRKWAVSGAAGLAVMGLIVLMVNVLGNWLFVRFDLTQNQSYSLSRSSRKLVNDLSDPVIIKAYFTPDLPAPYNVYERYVRDLLTEYHSASHGRVRFEFAPTSPPAEFEKKANEAGLLPIQFEQLGSDQVQIRRGFMGLVLFHRDKSETLPIIKDVQQLEYDITSRMAKMARRTKKVVALTSGHGELKWASAGKSKLADDMSELYEIRDTALPMATTAAFSADVLVVMGPKQKMDAKSLWTIDQAIMRGIPTAFLIDIKNLMVNQFYAASLDSGLPDFLKSYGVQVGNRYVYDAQCETIGITQNMAGFAYTTSMRYPYIPLVDRILTTHPLGRGMDSVGLPFVAPVEAIQGLPPTIHFTPLLYSSSKSWLAPAEANLSVAPNAIPQPTPTDPHGPYSVGAVFEGTFTSYFAGKPAPIPGQTLIGASSKTQIVVLGTAKILDPSVPAFPGADALVSNMLAYLSKDETLAGIRSKGAILRPLAPLSNASRGLVRYGTVVGVAALPVLLGLWRWRSRQAWRQTVSAAFAPKTV